MSESTDVKRERPWSGIRWPVFLPASIVILAMIIFSAAAAGDSEEIFGRVNTWVTEGIGWWYILIVTIFVIFSLYCGLSKIGSIRLGRDDERPEFSNLVWFAMLFSAGMGIGLVFWGAAEPLSHLVDPPSIGGEQAEGIAAADQAMRLTMFHWGLHAWAIYVVIGLGLAYMTYRRGRPMSVRWLLEPLLGRRRMEGWLGHAVDAMAIVGTLFGIATSLGLGVQQIVAGLGHLGWVSDPNNLFLLVVIVVITSIATFSVASGVNRGLKWLSNINLGLAGGLLLFVLLVGPTLLLLRAWVDNLGGYFAALPELSLRMSPLDAEEPIGDTWLSSWTIFYWGWWMSWAPFVGMFIARISRGRTIREFVFGVLIAPTLVASVWFTVFGESALFEQLTMGNLVGPDGVVDTNVSLFLMLEGLPLSTISSVLAICVIALFFITSSDSGSLVIDMIAHGGRTDTPKSTRIYWAVLEGLAAAVLLIAGGSAALVALQTASIVTAVPISIILALTVVSMLRAFRYDLSQTPHFLHIVAGPDELRIPGASGGDDGARPAGEQVVAVNNIDPQSVELNPGSKEMEFTEDPVPDDPLAHEVFDTPEFAASATGAALKSESSDSAADDGEGRVDNEALP